MLPDHPTAWQSVLDFMGARFGEVDAALRQVGSDARDSARGLRELVDAVRRLEARLDQLAQSAGNGAEGGRAVAGGKLGWSYYASAPQPDTFIPKASPTGFGGGCGAEAYLAAYHGRAESMEPVWAREGDYYGVEARASGTATPAPEVRVANNPARGEERLDAVGLKLERLDKKLERIAGAVGARAGPGIDGEESRRRLKEKLKEAIDSEERSRLQLVETEQERWMEYIFGICMPNGRIGKCGSRCADSDGAEALLVL